MPEQYDDASPAPRPKNYGEAPKRKRVKATTPSELRRYEPYEPEPEIPIISAATAEPRYEILDEDDLLAHRAMVAAERLRDIYKGVSPTTTYHAPDTTFYTAAVQNNAVTTYITEDTTVFFASALGNENVAAFMGSELLSNPAVREYTIDVLQQIVRAPYPVGVARGSGAEMEPEEILRKALDDPSFLETIGPGPRIEVMGLANELLQGLQGLPSVGLPGQLQRAVAIGVTRDVSMALSPQDIEMIEEVIRRYSLGRPDTAGGLAGAIQMTPEGEVTVQEVDPLAGGRTADTQGLVAHVGIEQVRQLGPGGVIVLNEEWARAHPDEAYAIKVYLEQEHPETTIQFGKEGAVGSLLTTVSIPIDMATAPFGSALVQLSELGERVGRTDADKLLLNRVADDIEKTLADGDAKAYHAIAKQYGEFYALPGGVDPNADVTWVQEAQRAVTMFRDMGTDEVGMEQFHDQMIRNTSPANVGFGFADSFTRATDLVPGDSWYGFAYATSGLLSAITVDPAFLVPGLVGGVRAARLIAKGRLPEGGIDFAKIAADARRARISQEGLEDVARLIPEFAEGPVDISRISKELKLLDSQSRRLVDRVRAIEKEVTTSAERYAIDSARAGAFFPEVGRGWVKNAVYRNMARFPEELAVTRPHMRAAKRLWTLREKLGPDKFAAGLARYLTTNNIGGGTDVARYLSTASSEADMALALTRAQVGLDFVPPNIDVLSSELGDVQRQLASSRLTEGVPGMAPALAEGDRLDLTARAAFLEDTIRGREWINPMQQGFTTRKLRQLERQAGEPWGPHGKLLMAATEFSERFPGNILDLIFAKPYRDIPDKAARSFMIAASHIYQPTGAGAVLTFPHTSPLAKGLRQLGGAVDVLNAEDSFAAISDVARFLGLSRDRTLELMTPWTRGELTTPSRSYQFMKTTWETIIDESPYLGATGRRELKQMYRTFTEERSPGWIAELGTRGESIKSPTVYKEIIRPDGSKFLQGRPAFEADMFEMWRIPSIGELRTYMAALQRTMKDWELAKGWGKRAVSHSHLILTQGWSAINSFWKTAVLGTRLIGALPARIQMEQMLRIAAYDYASLVWHPVEWFASTGRGIRYFGPATDAALFLDSPTHALGVMIDRVQKNPSFGNRFLNVVSIANPAEHGAFFRSYSNRVSRMFASPSVNRWHLPHMGREVVTPAILPYTGGNFVRLPPNVAAEAGYVYHLTPAGNFESIRTGGLLPGPTETGTFFSRNVGTPYFLPSRHARQDLIQLRVRESAVPEWSRPTDEIPLVEGVTRQYLPPGEVEFLAPDGTWHRLDMVDAADATLDAMNAQQRGVEMLAHYADSGMDPVLAIERTQQELAEIIGTGEGADMIRTAIRRGAVAVDGKMVRAGTADFAHALQDMFKRGDWNPGVKWLNQQAGEYLPLGREGAMADTTNMLFRTFYTRPDLAMSRVPLFRQMAGRHYRNLLRIGYPADKAMDIARARAARGTADLMFTIGAKTSGEYFLRNISPFFPAWRELANTWLKRIPLRVGEGHWGLGAVALARRADIWVDFFVNAGIVQKDADGRLYLPVPLPGFSQLFSFVTGAEVSWNGKAPLESLAGLFPVPANLFAEDDEGNPLPWSERLKGTLFTLGAPATLTLAGANSFLGGALDEVDDWMTFSGTDTSAGPLAWDRAFEAFGVTAPWMSNTTAETHMAIRQFAVTDGMRIAQMRLPMPDWETYAGKNGVFDTLEEQEAFRKDYQAWAEEIRGAGERYATLFYGIRAIGAATLPFSLQFIDEGKQKTSALWALINAFPEQAGGGEMRSVFIDAFNAEYPDLAGYMTGKTNDLRPVDHPNEDIDEFMDAIQSGEIVVRNSTDWMVMSYLMNSYSVHRSRIDAIYEAAGDNAAEVLMNTDAQGALDRERAKWDDFLDLLDANPLDGGQGAPKQDQSASDMFQMYMAYAAQRDGEIPRLSIEQSQLLTASGIVGEYEKYLMVNPETASEWYALKDEAFSVLGNAQTEVGRGTDYFYNDILSPYMDARSALFDKLGTVEKRFQGPVFQELRDLADEYNKPYNHPRFGNFPTPEEYLFSRLTSQEQQVRVADWAALPATFLTEFQRDQVGYEVPKGKVEVKKTLEKYLRKAGINPKNIRTHEDAANALSSLSTYYEGEFDKLVARRDLSTSSTEYENLRIYFDEWFADRAADLGLEDYWRQAHAPTYRRVDRALGLSERSVSWRAVVEQVGKWRKQIEAENYSPGGTSDIAQKLHRRLDDMVERYKRNDPQFRQIMIELGVALGEPDRPLVGDDLTLVLFMDFFEGALSNTHYLDI